MELHNYPRCKIRPYQLYAKLKSCRKLTKNVIV